MPNAVKQDYVIHGKNTHGSYYIRVETYFEIIFVPKLMNTISRMTLKSSVVIFWALETSAVSLTSAASTTSLASTASTALFPQTTH